jgi:pimeloyl-ACP methyl ester carboxylesterase
MTDGKDGAERGAAADGHEVLAHVVTGAGSPVLLLNGGLMSLSAWEPVSTRLETRHTVVRCDLRGQLLSPGPPPPSLRGHADDAARLLAHLGHPRAHVAGASFGALVALTMAAAHPERVRSVAAITATDRVTPGMWGASERLREACRHAADGGDRAAVFDLLVPGTFSPEYRRRCAGELAARRAAIGLLPARWFGDLASMLAALQDLDLRPLLPDVRCPALVLGAGRDETFPVAHAQALAAALPGAHLRIVPEAPHGLVVEAPDLVAESLLQFLEEADGRA